MAYEFDETPDWGNLPDWPPEGHKDMGTTPSHKWAVPDEGTTIRVGDIATLRTPLGPLEAKILQTEFDPTSPHGGTIRLEFKPPPGTDFRKSMQLGTQANDTGSGLIVKPRWFLHRTLTLRAFLDCLVTP